ncbi:MAG: hypothetical protein V4508_23985 [Pseudomonadota bacterium]
MLSATIKLILREARQVLQLGKSAVPEVLRQLAIVLCLAPLMMEMRCARRLDSLAARLSRMRNKIDSLGARLQRGMVHEAIDADHSFRDALAGLKEEIRLVRCQLAWLSDAHRHGNMGVRLQRAFDNLHKVAEQTYAAADKLQWDIAEHDSRFLACTARS